MQVRLAGLEAGGSSYLYLTPPRRTKRGSCVLSALAGEDPQRSDSSSSNRATQICSVLFTTSTTPLHITTATTTATATATTAMSTQADAGISLSLLPEDSQQSFRLLELPPELLTLLTSDNPPV